MVEQIRKRVPHAWDYFWEKSSETINQRSSRGFFLGGGGREGFFFEIELTTLPVSSPHKDFQLFKTRQSERPDSQSLQKSATFPH